MKRRCESLCPNFQRAMDVLAKPWSGVMLATLEPGPLRFSELHERIGTIGDRMLAVRLKELEACGAVVRQVDPGPPVRVTYELTKAGSGFGNVIAAVSAWGKALAAADEKRRRKRK